MNLPTAVGQQGKSSLRTDVSMGKVMNTKQTVDSYYKEEYDVLVEYAMNRNGWKDTIKLTYEEAVNVVGDMYGYHSAHPDKFDAKWVHNILGQYRKNYVRNRGRGVPPPTIPLDEWHEEGEVDAEMSEVDEQLLYHINTVSNHRHRLILVNHLIRGEPISESGAKKKMVIKRFREKMRASYEDDVGW